MEFSLFLVTTAVERNLLHYIGIKGVSEYSGREGLNLRTAVNRVLE
jgi:hypothetical protein